MSANLDLVRWIYADSERGDYGSAAWRFPRSSIHSPAVPTPAVAQGERRWPRRGAIDSASLRMCASR